MLIAVLAASMTLAWDPSPDFITEYRLYVRRADGSYNVGIPVSGTTLTITVDRNVTYHAQVTARNQYGESTPSNEITFRFTNKRRK